MPDRLTDLMKKQLELQLTSFNTDPRDLQPVDRCEYLMWNAFALCDEIHEAMQEVGWKPWAASRHVNEERLRQELIDALHFLLNMWMASFPPETSVHAMADQLAARYEDKRRVNADRQANGYDGVSSKCPGCGRELTEAEVFKTVSGFGSFDVVDWFCQCGKAIDNSTVEELGLEA
jgi:hypothetical protein